jgi:hypothetical protein
LSSGVIPNYPQDGYSFTSPAYSYQDYQNSMPQDFHEFDFVINTTYSLAPIGISYSCIKEINEDGSYTIYKYSTVKDNPTQEDGWPGQGNTYVMQTRSGSSEHVFSKMSHPFVRAKSPNECMRGLLTEKKQYSASNQIVKSTSYTYNKLVVGTHTNAFEQHYVPGRPMYYNGCYCNRSDDYSNATQNNDYADWYFCRIYDIPVAIAQLTQETDKLYDQNSTTKFRQTQTKYYYNSDNFQPARVVQIDIEGKVTAEEFYYASDYADNDQNGNPQMSGEIASLRQRNMLTPVIEHRYLKNPQLINGSYVNGQVVKGELAELSAEGQPVKRYVLETNSPITNMPFNNSQYLLNSQYYKLREQLFYDPNTFKLISKTRPNGTSTSIIWGYNNNFPIATVTGSKSEGGVIYHTSFEDVYYAYDGGKTGSKHIEGTYEVPLPLVIGSYKLTYWTAPINSTQAWAYNEETVVISTANTVASKTIDLLRGK